MTTTASLNQSDQKPLLPEEKVRRGLIDYMVEELGYPPALIQVEQSLHQLPHLQRQKDLPLRRADLLVFGKQIHPEHSLYPLLLVECKAEKVSSDAIEQVIGYNYYVGAYYIAVVGKNSVRFGSYDSARGEYVFIEQLPPYEILLRNCCL